MMQNREVLWKQLSACSARDYVGDNVDFWELLGDGFDIFSANLQRTGSVVVGVNKQDGFYTCILGIFCAFNGFLCGCLLYTSDAADEEDSVDLGGRRII